MRNRRLPLQSLVRIALVIVFILGSLQPALAVAHQKNIRDDQPFLPFLHPTNVSTVLETDQSLHHDPLAQGGPDDGGYTFTDSTEPGATSYQWEDISGSGNEITDGSSNDDTCLGPVTIDFPFPFYGNNYTELYISSNGYVSFGSSCKAIPKSSLPNPDDPQDGIIMPFGGDMYITGGTTHIYTANQSSPQRFVIEFDDLDRYAGRGSLSTFQILLYPNGTIQTQYKDVSYQPSYVGIEDESGLIGLSYPDEVSNGLALSYYPAGETPPDLTSSTKLAPTTRILPGERIQYTVVLSNTGGQTASSTTMHDSIPSTTTYVPDSVDSEGGGTVVYNSTENRIEWSGDVPGNTTVRVTYEVTASDSLLPYTLIENVATISSGSIPADLNVSASVCIDCGSTASQSVTTSPYTGTVKPDQEWSYNTGDAIDSDIVIAPDGTIYIANNGGSLCALNADGSEKWCNNAYGLSPISSTLTLASDGRMYIGAGDHLLALNADGSEIWRFSTGGLVLSQPAIGEDGTIYVGSTDGFIYAVNPTGTIKWKYNTSLAINTSSPVVATNDTIYIGTSGYLYALSLQGTVQWRRATGDSSYATPTIAPNGNILIGSTNGTLYAFSPSGAEAWTKTLGKPIYSAVSVADNGTIYVAGGDTLYAIKSGGGSYAWSYTTGGDIRTSPVIDATGNVFIGSFDQNLHVFAADGSRHAQYDVGASIGFSSPAIGPDGKVYIGSHDGSLYAFKETPPDPVGSIVSSPSILQRGQNIEFSLVVYNQGGQTLTETTVINPIPPQVSYAAPQASITPLGNGTLTYSDTANLLLWEHGTIEGLKAITITYHATVSPGLTLLNPIINSFTIDSPLLENPVTSERQFCIECYPADSIQPVYRLDPSRSGRSMNNGPNDPDLGIWAKWKHSIGGQVKASSIISPDGTLVIGAGTTLMALEPSGSMRWLHDVGGNINATVALAANGTVYVPAGDSLVAVSLGGASSELWRFPVSEAILSAPVIGPDGTIYFGSTDGYVYAVSVFGDLIWKYNTEATINYSAPTLGPDGTLYIGNGEYLTAISITYGTPSLKWRYLTGDSSYSTPTIGPDNTIYIGSMNGFLYAINPDGTLKWQHDIGKPIESAPTIGTDGRIYVAAGNDLYAVDPDSNGRKLLHSTGARITSSPTIDTNGIIFFGSTDGFIYAVREDGTLMGQKGYHTDGSISYSSAVIDTNGMVFIGSDDGNLYAMVIDQRPSNISLSPNWEYEENTTNATGQPTIANDELVGTLSSSSPVLDDVFTYELRGPVDSPFKLVNGNEIRVRDVTRLDYDDVANQQYTISVRTFNSRGLYYDKNITINLRPVNEYAPTELFLSNNLINEPTPGGTGNGTVIGYLGITQGTNTYDRDVGDHHTYEWFSDSCAGCFAVVNNQLRIFNEAGFDCEAIEPDQQTVTVKVVDSGGLAYTDVFTIRISQINEPPIAGNDSAGLNEDTSVTIDVLANDRDPEGSLLSLEVTQQPLHGSLTKTLDNKMVYTPYPDYFGTDSFRYRVFDGINYSTEAEVYLTIANVNDPPIAKNDTYRTDESTVLSVTQATGLLQNDLEKDQETVTIEVVTPPAHGGFLEFNTNNGSFIYQPDTGNTVNDSFTYRLTDARGTVSEVATVTITIGANNAPVARNDSFTTSEGKFLTITKPGVLHNDSDMDSDLLTPSINTSAVNGIVSLEADGSFTYRPKTNFTGRDSFTYYVSDGKVDSPVATVFIDVGINQPPVAVSNNYSIPEDTVLNIAALGVLENDYDPEGNQLSAELVKSTQHGALMLNPNGSFDYTPNQDFDAVDWFTYQVNDGNYKSNVVTVTIDIIAVAEPPVAEIDTYSVPQEQKLVINAPGVLENDNDPDKDTMQAIRVSDPANGTLTLNLDGSFTYQPNAGFAGTDRFTYKAKDALHSSTATTVTITIRPNVPPIALSDVYTTTEDAMLSIDASNGVKRNDNDPDGDTFSVILETPTTHGDLGLNPDGSFTYTPDAGFTGSDSFTYKAHDGKDYSNVVTVTFNIIGNGAPVAASNVYGTPEDTVLSVTTSLGVLSDDYDPEGKPLKAILYSETIHGDISLELDGSFTYTPMLDFLGNDSFSYRAFDGKKFSSVVTVTITVSDQNDLPIANNDDYSTNEDTPLVLDVSGGVLANDTDADILDVLQAIRVDEPGHGTVALQNNGAFIYTPDKDYFGPDSFTYRIFDGRGYSVSNATVSITVDAVNDPPEKIANNVMTVKQGSSLNSISNSLLRFMDIEQSDASQIEYTVLNIGSGTLNVGNSFTQADIDSGNLLYTPGSTSAISDSMSFTVSDGTNSVGPFTFNITIVPVSVILVETNESTVIAEGGTSGDTYTLQLASKPSADVIVTITPNEDMTVNPSTLTFTPDTWNSPKIVTVRAVDDNQDEGTESATITHSAVSGDPFYNNIGIADVAVTITDNDAAAVVISKTEANVTEGGANDTYTVVLARQPSGDVQITLSADPQVLLTPSTLTFTSADWSSAKTISISAVNDDLADGSHDSTITHSTSSADADYDGIDVANVVVHVTDNDSPGISLSKNNVYVTEGGAEATYAIQLMSQPTANVRITFGTNGQVEPLDSRLFTPTNWEQPQSITVRATNDALIEGSHTSVITHSVASGDTDYNGMLLHDVTANITDNDTAGVTLSRTDVAVTEGDTCATYNLALTSQPVSPVTITFTTDAYVQELAPIVLTSSTWNQPQTIAVCAVDGDVAEGTHYSTITHNTSSADANYQSVAVPGVSVTITDNDSAGVSVSPVSLNTTENGTDATYTLVLMSQPTGNVTITLGTDTQVQSLAPVSFTPANWNQPRTVTVHAVDDDVDENSNHSSTITHSANGGGYDAVTIPQVTVTIVDNDSVGVDISQSNVAVTEGGASGTYNVTLTTKPTDDVTIRLTTNDQLSVSPDVFTFTPTNWNQPRTVTISAVDDAFAEGQHFSTIAHSASGGGYDGVLIDSVLATVTDNDTAGVELIGPNITVTEGGTSSSYTIKLTSKPTSDVTINIQSDDQVSATPSQITITPATWQNVKTIVVDATNDNLAEGVHSSTITHRATSTDNDYQGIGIGNATVTINDNDSAGIEVSKANVSVTEGGTNATYSIRLTSKPANDVVVDLVTDTQVSLSTAQHTFTTTNWDTPWVITVSAVNDVRVEGNHNSTIIHKATSSDAAYHNISIADVTVHLTDNDNAGVDMSATDVNVSESGTEATYTIRLTSQPTEKVTITLTTDTEQASLSKTVLDFTPTNWNTPQTIRVTANDDNLDESDTHYSTITHQVSSSDGDYDGIGVPAVTVSIADNDTRGVQVSPTNLSLSEGGNEASYTVVLKSKPTSNVRITVTTGSQIKPVASLLFTPDNWSVEQEVSMQAVDDDVAEGNHNSSITHSISGGNYDTVSVAAVAVSITDNDTVAVDVSRTSMTLTEDGSGATYSVKLKSRPTSDVTIQPAIDELLLHPVEALVFTPQNWNVSQKITVTALMNEYDNTNKTTTITHKATSSDASYNGVTIGSITVTILDEDEAGIDVTPLSVNVQEGSTPATYTVRLTSEPTADVVITVHTDSQVQNITQLRFTAQNWDTPQHIQIRAVDDNVQEGNQASQISHTVSSEDTNYNGIGISNVTVAISDNDTANVEVLPTNINVVEGDASATYSVRLTSQPQDDVTIALNFDTAQLIVSPVELFFTPGNWSTPKTIHVQAQNDNVSEGPQNSTITHQATSNDAAYQGIGIANVAVAITDNDTPGIAISRSSVQVTEGSASNATYTIVLTSQPLNDVTINLSVDDQMVVNPSQVIFTTVNWNTPQTIQLNAANDDIQEGTHAGTITHHTTSDDAAYHNYPLTNVVATITDNDTAGVDLSRTTVNVSEGGASASYTMRLTSQPTATVVIALQTDDEVAESRPTLTFTPGDWNVAQTISLNAVNDFYAEGAHYSTVGHTVSSADPAYDGIAIPIVEVTVTDNDTKGVVINPATLNVTEGGADTSYTVKLTSRPTSNVTVTVGTDSQLQSIAPLVFTPDTWATEQTILVRATDDDVDEGGQHASTITHSSSGGGYDSLTISNLITTISDNDSAGVDISQTSLTANENGAAVTYRVKLTSKPTSNVAVQVNTDTALQPVAALTFTPLNWNTQQIVTVQVQANDIADGNRTSTIAHQASSGDAMYNEIGIASVTVNIVDDDSANIEIIPTDLSLIEGGASVTYTVRLTSQPVADVKVNVQTDSQIQDIAPLLFTAANWNQPRTVVVTTNDDDRAEGDHASTITHQAISTDTDYNGINIASVVLRISDNDTASVAVSKTDVNVTEGDSAQTYSIRLTSQPQDEVTIALNFDTTQLIVSPVELFFTPGNWSTPKTIEVQAKDDDVSEGPQNRTITHQATSNDTAYQGIGIANVAVAMTDNDTPGIAISRSSLDVTEGSATNAIYTIVLKSQPRDDVTVKLSVNDQVAVNPSQVVFTADNWEIPQTIQANAVNDNIQEGMHAGTITHQATSNDADYHNYALTNVVATITDNDTAGVDLSRTTVNVSEGGASASYTIRLTSQPTATVVIALQTDDQVAASRPTVTFTPDEWNIAQTITLDAVNDYYAEGTHYSTVGHTASSTDPAYDGIAIPMVETTITDNDSKGVLINPTALNVTEGGADTSYTVKLTSKPTSNVTMTMGTDSQLEAIAPRVFTPDNWATEQTILVRATDDNVDEGGQHASTITHSASGGGYDSVEMDEVRVAVTITDNDSAGVDISQTSLNATENGPALNYRVKLTSKPNSDVTIQFSAESDVQSIEAKTFTPLNWNTPQTVTVQVLANDIADGNRTSTIAHQASSGDALYNGIGIPSVAIAITDDDSANVIVSSTELALAEGGEAMTYTVRLTSQPVADVTVQVHTDSQIQAIAPLLFTDENWNQPQAIVVATTDDHRAEGLHASTITHQATSADTDYNNIGVASVTARISDNETTGIQVSRTDVNVTEGGTTDTYTIRLTSEPTADVTIILYPSPQVLLSTTVLTFTADNWSAEQTITVFAKNDNIAEGNHNGTITHSASGGDYRGVIMPNVAVAITDDDSPGVDLSRTTMGITEDSTCGSYTIVLKSQPTANVTIDIATDEHQIAPIQPIVFSDTTWNQPQTVSVCIIDDNIAEGTHISTITHTASGGGYDAMRVHDIDVAITDDDVEGVDISRDSVSVTEGGADATYTLKLTSQPTSTVIIEFVTDIQVQKIVTRTFTTDNWDTPQTITVRATDDDIAEGIHASTIAHRSVSSDSRYNGQDYNTVTVHITDNEVAGISVSRNTLSVSEAGIDESYTIRLTSEPTAPVTVTIQVEEAKVTVQPLAYKVFTAANWKTPQTVQVKAINDHIAEGADLSTMTHSASSMDEDYQGISIPAVNVNVADDDTPNVTISRATANVSEDGTTDVYTVSLTSQPVATVAITISTDTQLATNPVVLWFNSANWQTPQSVQIRAVNDQVAEGSNAHSTITHKAGSADPHYNNIGINPVTVGVTDNDTAGIIVWQSLLTVSETGTTAVYSITLTSQPVFDVTIHVRVDDQITATPAALTFTPTNWQTAQFVTIEAIDDNIDEDDHASTVTHDVSSLDPDYRNSIPSVSITIADDDTAGVTVHPANIRATENGQDGVYTIVLNSQPLTDVIITMKPSNQVMVVPPFLTFTEHNWNKTQPVTVSAKVDDYVEGNQMVKIDHSATGSQYKDMAIDSVDVEVIDNNTPGVRLLDTSVNVTEGTITDTYRLRLSSRPTETVVIGVFADTQVQAAPTTLTFEPGEWNIAQPVVVSPIDDSFAERTHTGTITHAVVSGKSFATSIPDVQANITDNDIASVKVIESDGDTAIVEDGSDTDVYDLVLTSQPRDDVLIEMQPDDPTQFMVYPITTTFTTDTWDAPRSITVRAIPDSVAEGIDTHKITHVAVSADEDYNEIGIPQATVRITDTNKRQVHVSKTEVFVTEGIITDTYEVHLMSQPITNVTVLLAGGSQILPQPSQLTFTPQNWAEAQTVIVEAITDDVAEGVMQNAITHSVSGGDYNGLPAPNVIAHIQDNNEVGIGLSEVQIKVTEGVITGTATYDVRLTSKPTSTVTVQIYTGEQVDVDKTSLTFVSDTTEESGVPWDENQTITVQATNDDIAELKDTITITHTASGGRYEGETELLTVDVFDLDKAAIVPNGEDDLDVIEGGSVTDKYSIRLNSQPEKPVTLRVDADEQIHVSPASLTFTPSDWKDAKFITVSGMEDNIAEGEHTGTITHTLKTTDNMYSTIGSSNVTVHITELKKPGVIVNPTSLNATEGGAKAQYTLVLKSKPKEKVDIALVVDEEQVELEPATVTFNPLEWNTVQTVTVTAKDDKIIEETHAVTITHAVASNDPDYRNIAVSDVGVNITDAKYVFPAGFITTTVTVEENEGFARIILERTDHSNTGPVTVTCETIGDTAVPGVDFEPVRGYITIPNKATSVKFTVPVSSDNDIEGDEWFWLKLGDESNIEDETNGPWQRIQPSEAPVSVSSSRQESSLHEAAFSSTSSVPTYSTMTLAAYQPKYEQVVYYESLSAAQAARQAKTQQAATVPALTTNSVTTHLAAANDDVSSPPALNNKQDTGNGESEDTLKVLLTDSNAPAEGILQFPYTEPVNAYEKDGKITITVSRNSGTNGDVSVDYETFSSGDGEATSGIDYKYTRGTLQFKDGQDIATFDIPITSDREAENKETFIVRLSNPTPQPGAVLGPRKEAVISIIDDSAVYGPNGAIYFSARNYSVSESDSEAVIDIFRTSSNLSEATVRFATYDGTANSDKDYGKVMRDITFPAGATTYSIKIPIKPDVEQEGTETINLKLDKPSGSDAIVGANGIRDTATLSIVDDDLVPGGTLQFSSEEYSGSENEDSRHVRITVYRTGGTNGKAQVNYAALPGTANADDFVPISGTLTFSESVTSQSFDVEILNDTAIEGEEIIRLELDETSLSGGAKLGSQREAYLTVTDNDSLEGGIIHFSESEYSTHESLSDIHVDVVRIGGNSGDVEIDYTVYNGTAKAGEDYILAEGKLTFVSGETTDQFTVHMIDDAWPEGNETALMVLSMTNPEKNKTAALGTHSVAVLNIVDDESPGVYFNRYEHHVREEGGEAEVAIRLTKTFDHQVSVDVETVVSKSTASSGLDYTYVKDPVTFEPGEDVAYAKVGIVNDTVPDTGETVFLRLSNPKSSSPELILGIPATTTISIHEPMTISLQAIQPQIGTEGSTTIVAHVTDSGGRVQNQLIEFSTSLGSVDPRFARTDGSGVATTTLKVSGVNAGQAVVTATVGTTLAAVEDVGPVAQVTVVVGLGHGIYLPFVQNPPVSQPSNEQCKATPVVVKASANKAGINQKVTITAKSGKGGDSATFATSLGNIEPSMSRTDGDGIARSELTCTREGKAKVTVTVNGCPGEIDVSCVSSQIELDVASEIYVDAGNFIPITVRVSDPNGNPLPGQNVKLYTELELGTIDVPVVTTDQNGVAKANLLATTTARQPYSLVTGSTTIIAESGGQATQKTVVFKPFNCNDVEPNNTLEQAQELTTIDQACIGSFEGEVEKEEDYYKVKVYQTSDAYFSLREIAGDYDLYVYDWKNKHKLCGEPISGIGMDEYQVCVLAPGVEYFIYIDQYTKATQPTHTYIFGNIITTKQP